MPHGFPWTARSARISEQVWDTWARPTPAGSAADSPWRLMKAHAEIEVHAVEVRVVARRETAGVVRAAEELIRQQVVVLEAATDLEVADVEINAAAERDGPHRAPVQSTIAVDDLVIDLEVGHAEAAEDVRHHAAGQDVQARVAIGAVGDEARRVGVVHDVPHVAL